MSNNITAKENVTSNKKATIVIEELDEGNLRMRRTTSRVGGECPGSRIDDPQRLCAQGSRTLTLNLIGRAYAKARHKPGPGVAVDEEKIR